MAKISISGNQLKISIPKDVAKMKEWDEDTELKFVPFLREPEDDIDENTTIMLKEVE